MLTKVTVYLWTPFDWLVCFFPTQRHHHPKHVHAGQLTPHMHGQEFRESRRCGQYERKVGQFIGCYSLWYHSTLCIRPIYSCLSVTNPRLSGWSYNLLD